MNDMILNKTPIIERSLQPIHEVYANNPKNLTNYTKQDSFILNIQRACEASIDLAMHLVNEYKLGVPKANREAFQFLQEANIIEPDLARTTTIGTLNSRKFHRFS